MLKAVTLDAYGTVFDFEAHLPEVAGQVLAAERLDGVNANALAEAWSSHFGAIYDEFGRCFHADGREFKTIAQLTTDALAEAYRQHGIKLDPWPGVEIWLSRLRAVKPFPEAETIIGMLAADYPLAMLSDTDDDIIAPALERLQAPFRFVLTSEKVQAYKQDPRAVLFRQALAELECEPHEVLHVGDSTADIRGAKTAGMRVAWVNRGGWPLSAGCPRPDFEIRDLAALPTIVESLS